MKHCPECNKNYADPTLSFCLDDGSSLIFGAAVEENETAIFSSVENSENATRTFGAAIKPDESFPQKAVDRRTVGGGVAILLLAALGIGAYLYYWPIPSKQIESIAVMPFSNESGNPEMEYLSDGMTEELIGTLQQIPKLSVKARSSVIRYKDKDAQTIGRHLNVQAILNGRVVQRGQALTLYVELVDARTENSLWKQSYNKAITDLVSLKNDIARDVAEGLKIRLSGEDEKRLAKNYTANAEAYRLYLLGRSYWNKRGKENVEKAIDYFQQAINLDANFALAYTGLTEAYAQPSQQPIGMTKAREAALKALSLDDSLADAHIAFARVLTDNDYDFAGAERELQRAIELDHGNALAHARYGSLLSNLGRFEAAEAEYRRALELEPLSPLFNTGYGVMLTSARRYDEAITQLNKSLEIDKNVFLTHAALGNVYQLKDNYSGSVEERARYFELNGKPDFAASMRDSYAKGGWEGYLHFMTRSGEGGIDVVSYYAALGGEDEAFAALNEYLKKRSFLLTGIKTNPLLDPLRDDPRFAELLRKVGFPE